jgi:type 1 glutamine amidotransferase
MKSILTLAVAACLATSLAAAETKPLRVLLITGGCCHDYKAQKDILKKGLEERANVEITQVHTDDKSTKPPLEILANADYAKGYDLVIHDECAADVNNPDTIKTVIKPHQDGLPAVNLHCAMHSYRFGNYREKTAPGAENARWYDYLGLQSIAHGPQEPIAIEYVDTQHPITRGLTGWTTIREELYNNITVRDGTHPLARGTQTVRAKKKDAEGKETVTERNDNSVVAWVNEYGPKKARVFSTTIGHNNATVSDPRYLDLITRGVLWACGKLDENGKPSAGYGPKAH